MTKNVLSIILALILLLSVLPLTVSAADVDTAESGESELTISKQPAKELTISYDSSSAGERYIIYPTMVFGVAGGTGSYTYDWYFGGDDEYAIGEKVATTTAPFYQVNQPGYWHCWVHDSSGDSVFTNRTRVIKKQKAPFIKARVKGTLVEWFATESEDVRPSSKYYIRFTRRDTSHNTYDATYRFELESKQGVGISRVTKYYYSTYENITPQQAEESSFALRYDSDTHAYSIDMQPILYNDRNFDDIAYSIEIEDESYITASSDSISYAFFDYNPVKRLYNGELTMYDPSQPHEGEIQIMDGSYTVGDKIRPNFNGGRFANNTDKVDVHLQYKSDTGMWENYKPINSDFSYTITSADINKRLRFIAIPKADIGRFAGEYYWRYDEYFVSNDITVADNRCTITFDSNGGTGTMAPVKVDKGSTYTLPECTFTPPEGKVFDKWAVNGVVSFGTITQITVNEDTVLEAQWKDAPTSTYSITGSATSFLEETDHTTIFLSKKSGDNYALQGSRTVSGNSGTYGFTGLSNGQYKLSVRKNNHVTREYNVTVLLGSKTQDVKINPIGDANLNGKVQANDAMMVYQHAQGKADAQLSGYALDCADVAPVGSPNGKVQAADAMVIYQQAQGKHPLF